MSPFKSMEYELGKTNRPPSIPFTTAAERMDNDTIDEVKGADDSISRENYSLSNRLGGMALALLYYDSAAVAWKFLRDMAFGESSEDALRAARASSIAGRILQGPSAPSGPSRGVRAGSWLAWIPYIL